MWRRENKIKKLVKSNDFEIEPREATKWRLRLKNRDRKVKSETWIKDVYNDWIEVTSESPSRINTWVKMWEKVGTKMKLVSCKDSLITPWFGLCHLQFASSIFVPIRQIFCLVLLQLPNCFGLVQIVCARPKK